MRPTTAVLRCVSVLSLAACASTGTTSLPSPAEAEASRRPTLRAGHRDPITAADIATINAASAYDAVVKLRANFLQSRGVNSFMQPVRSTRPIVFIDGMEVGTLFELRSIPAGDVAEIRFLSSGEATIRYGDGYMAGIIAVTTKR
jgi:hypothetical protein